MITTSYFYKSKNIEGINHRIVSIVRGKPRHYSGIKHQLKSLAPTHNLTREFMTGYASEKEYVASFNTMLASLNVNDVINELLKKTRGAEPILMCYCSPYRFCHRHLVAEWIEKETGETVKELNYRAVSRFQGRIVKFPSRIES